MQDWHYFNSCIHLFQAFLLVTPIWHSRNQRRFHDRSFSVQQYIYMVVSKTHVTGTFITSQIIGVFFWLFCNSLGDPNFFACRNCGCYPSYWACWQEGVEKPLARMCDSIFFGVQAFSNSSLIPWPLKNRWYNCIDIAKNMNFIVDYIYKEDNSFVSAELNKNWTGLPNYWFL